MRLFTVCLLLLYGAVALNVGPDYSHPIEGRVSVPLEISKLNTARSGRRPPLLATGDFCPS